MKDLTIEQLEAQKEAINTARFLMENSYNASEETISELEKTFKLIDEEIADRLR